MCRHRWNFDDDRSHWHESASGNHAHRLGTLKSDSRTKRCANRCSPKSESRFRWEWAARQGVRVRGHRFVRRCTGSSRGLSSLVCDPSVRTRWGIADLGPVGRQAAYLRVAPDCEGVVKRCEAGCSCRGPSLIRKPTCLTTLIALRPYRARADASGRCARSKDDARPAKTRAERARAEARGPDLHGSQGSSSSPRSPICSTDVRLGPPPFRLLRNRLMPMEARKPIALAPGVSETLCRRPTVRLGRPVRPTASA